MNSEGKLFGSGDLLRNVRCGRWSESGMVEGAAGKGVEGGEWPSHLCEVRLADLAEVPSKWLHARANGRPALLTGLEPNCLDRQKVIN